MQDVEFRDFDNITDRAFVIDSWMKSFYANSPFTVHLDKREFLLQHLPIVNRLLRIAHVQMMVEQDAPEVIVGYIVYEPGFLHYLYVKEAFRGFGFANELLRYSGLPKDSRVTHLTERGRKLLQKFGFIYSPYFNL